MKKICLYSMCMVCAFCFTCKALPTLPDLSSASYPLRGESDLSRLGRNSYVDWIISTVDLVAPAKQSDFRFAYNFNTAMDQGDYATYTGSLWFYYYQIENTSGNFATSFSLNLNPDFVLTAGYVLNVDIDTDLSLSHLDTDPGLTGEYENLTALIANFSSATFDPNPPTPNASLNFDLGFQSGKESTLFFVTSYTPPQYLISELLAGPQGPVGDVPVPSIDFPIILIPEPTTLLLLFSAIGVLVYLKRK